MRKIANLRSARWFRWPLGLALLGVAAFAGGLALGQARTPPVSRGTLPGATPVDPNQQIVARVYGNEVITREELGEWLVKRYGGDKLEMLINRRIIDLECRRKGIPEVTPAEIEAALQNDLRNLSNPQHVVTLQEFEEKILKERHITLFEWTEDVITPRLLLTKLARARVKTDDEALKEDLEKAFEAHHGRKFKGRLIMWPEKELSRVQNSIYGKIRDNEAEFDAVASSQGNAQLAARGGHIKPFGRYSTGNEDIELALFRLKPGEVSPVMMRPEGVVVFKCDEWIPADPHVKLADVQAKLREEVIDKKTQIEMHTVFKEMHDHARPLNYLKPQLSRKEFDRQVQEEIIPAGGKLPK